MINQKDIIKGINKEFGFRIPAHNNILDFSKIRLLEHIGFWLFDEDREIHNDRELFLEFFREFSEEDIINIIIENGIDIDSIPEFKSNHNMRLLRAFERFLGFNIGFNKEFLDYGREGLIRFFSWEIFYHDLKGKRLDEEIESLFNEMDPRDILIDSGIQNPDLIQGYPFLKKLES